MPLEFWFWQRFQECFSLVFAIEAGYSLTRIFKPDHGHGMPRLAST